MQNYDLIIGFGCSFTEGGGLENLDIYKFLNNIPTTSNVEYSDMVEYRYKNNFIAYLAKLLNCDYINLAESMASNDLIFQKIYDYFKTIDITNKKILVITQLSIFSRQHVYYDNLKKFVKLNRTEFSDEPFNKLSEYKPLHEYFTNYISFIYNQDNAILNAKRNIELYDVWLKNKNIKTLWLSYDGDAKNFSDVNNFITFDGLNLGRYMLVNKLRLADVPNCPIPNLHLSLEGHNHIANKIYDKIKNI